MEHDANADVRAVILVAQPFPPLPLMVLTEDTEELRFVNSHDLQSHFLNISQSVSSTAQHRQRQAGQEQIYVDLCDDLRGSRNASDMYDVYCKHTRRLLSSYVSNKTDVMDFRFKPLDDILDNDRILRSMQAYTRARALLFETDIQCSTMTYSECLKTLTELTLDARDNI